eukprot:jgi/Ulvmu1/12705/UM095_0009.1
MQSELHDKARNLGRPLSSFRQRDMSLNEAQPSVLSQRSPPSEAIRANGKVIRTISAPRIVYSRFDGAETDRKSHNSSDRTTPTSNAGAASGTAHTDLLSVGSSDEVHDRFRPQKVQFRDSRNQVTMYTPSPTSSPTAAHFTYQGQQAMDEIIGRQNLQLWSAGPVQTQAEEQQDGGISRCASNLASRSGTFDEIVDKFCRPKHASTEELGAMVVGVCPPMASRKPADAPTTSTLDDMLPPSRCASNMAERAGTFDEILASQIAAHPLSVFDSLLDDSGMLSTASISSKQPNCCPPTRCVSNMMSSAGTFSEVLDATEDAVDKELFDGTISRRATNMHTAAGAFEELVDEDGDELDPEEHSCSSIVSGGEAESADIIFGGLVSNTEMLHSSTAELAPPLACKQSSRQQRHQNGSECVAHFVPQHPIDQDVAVSAVFMGMLPSDSAPVLDERGGCNPLAASGQLDVCDEQAARGLARHSIGFEHADMAWTSQKQQVLVQSAGSSHVIACADSTSQDRLSIIQAQIEHLTVEEQRLLLCTLSAQFQAQPEAAVEAASSTAHLSIHTPRRTLTQFQLDDEVEGIFSGPLHLSGSQLQKTMSTRSMSVRTPRVRYDVMFNGDENVDMPSAMAGLEDKQDCAARAILTPMEWSLKFARKPTGGSNIGALGNTLQQNILHGKAMLQPTSTRLADRTTRLGAFRPDGHSDDVWANEY